MIKNPNHNTQPTNESEFERKLVAIKDQIDSVMQKVGDSGVLYGSALQDMPINERLDCKNVFEVTCYQITPVKFGGDTVQFTEVFDDCGKLLELRLGIGVGDSHTVDYRIDPVNLRIEKLELIEHANKSGTKFYTNSLTTIDPSNSDGLDGVVGQFTFYCGLSDPITYDQALGKSEHNIKA